MSPGEDPPYASDALTFCIDSIPNAYPDGENGDVRVKVISGKSFGVESPVRPLGESARLQSR